MIKSRTAEDPGMVLTVAHRKAVTNHKLKMDKKGNVIVGRSKPMPFPEGSKNLADMIEFLCGINLSKPDAAKVQLMSPRFFPSLSLSLWVTISSPTRARLSRHACIARRARDHAGCLC